MSEQLDLFTFAVVVVPISSMIKFPKILNYSFILSYILRPHFHFVAVIQIHTCEPLTVGCGDFPEFGHHSEADR